MVPDPVDGPRAEPIFYQAASAEQRLRVAERFLRSLDPRSGVLIVAPSPAAALWLVGRVLQPAQARVAWYRRTPSMLAEELALPELAMRDLVPVRGLGCEALCARVIHELGEARQLGRYAALRERPGFAGALSATLGELRLAGIEPEQLSSHDAALARLLHQYVRALHEAKLADPARVLEMARQRALVRSDATARLPLVAVDIVLQSQAEANFFAALCADRPASCAVHPIGDERSQRYWRSALGALPMEARERDVRPAETDLERLQQRLFSLQGEGENAAVRSGGVRSVSSAGNGREAIGEDSANAGSCNQRVRSVSSPSNGQGAVEREGENAAARSEGVRIVSSPGEGREAVAGEGEVANVRSGGVRIVSSPGEGREAVAGEGEVANVRSGGVRIVSSPGEGREAVEVARGLLEAAEEGVAFDRMAVVLRAADSYRSVVEEALARAGIPAHFADGVRRPSPEGRALLALLRCAQTGLGARAFAEYLSLAVTPGLELDGDTGGVSPRKWERLLIDSGVRAGRDRWRRRLAGHAHALTAELSELEPDDPARGRHRHELERLDALVRFAEPILDALDALPEGKTWREWLDALDALARRAVRSPDGVCETLAELAPLGALGPVGLRDVMRVLSRRLGSVLSRSTGSGAGRVFVGSVEDVLGRSFERVFVMGLAERIFPPRIDPDPLLPDAARVALGPSLIQPDERVARERLAMRVAVGAASERVVLSFPRFDVQHNRARVPSFYGLEALRAVEGRLPAFDELSRRADTGAAARLGWPAPEEPGRAIDDAEYDLAMLSSFRARPAERAGAARYFVLSNSHLARALRFRARRWTVTRFMPTDGLVLDDANRALLASHQLDARAYSATALAHFAACPYRFYLHAIAGISPRADVLELDELDARQRGVLFHSTQRRLLEALRERGWLPLAPHRRQEALQLLEHSFGEAAAAARDAFVPGIARVFDAALETTRGDLQQWLTRLADETGWYALHTELGFGSTGRDLDPVSRSEPVRLSSGVTLRGAVDVVERRAEPDPDGRVVLRATDHKTGAVPDKLGTITGGKVLQPALYALALEQLFPEARIDSGRLYFCTTRAGFLSHEVPLDARARDASTRLGEAVREALRAGFLPAAPGEDECTRCAYTAVCGPYEEERVARVKTHTRERERLAPLFRLRVTP